MDVTQEQREALDIARQLIGAGIPVFAAPPCPAAHGGTCDRPGHGTGRQEYDLPGKWQLTVPSEVWLEKWQPGWALGAVGGHRADFLDEDPRNGGTDSIEELLAAGHMPRVFGVQSTPSGGFHHVTSPLGEREANGFMPGLDYQGGAPDGQGRAFVWIAPTVKRSKINGVESAYRWIQPPDLDYLAEFSEGDDSVEELRGRLHAARTRKERVTDDRAVREFTEGEARSFCEGTLNALAAAQIGQIEERANAAAVQLSHFVPDFWSAEFAYEVLLGYLQQTAYDPEHPAAGWDASKFRPVIAGENGRAPADWKAVRRAESVQEVLEEASADDEEVDALLAEMLSPQQMEEIPPPRHLIYDLLTLDSEAWMIGGPGSKKSFTMLDMAACISTGRPWQGREVTQGTVVVIVAEGASGTGKRVKAWQKKYGQMGRVHFLPRPVQVANFKAWAVLVKACKRLDPVLVVLDTQARVTVGLEENSAKDMGVLVEAVRAIREATGACVMPLHHTGKGRQDARGSSALNGAQGTELTVEVKKGSLSGVIKITKQKDIEEGEDIPLHFEKVDLGVDERGKPINSLVLTPPDEWRDAEIVVAEVDPGQVEHTPDPVVGGWTWKLVPHNSSHNVRRILQVLDLVGGEGGITEASVKQVVLSRWYEGRPLKKDSKGYLSPETWQKSWSAARDLVHAGERVLVRPEGQRWAINPVAVSSLR